MTSEAVAHPVGNQVLHDQFRCGAKASDGPERVAERIRRQILSDSQPGHVNGMRGVKAGVLELRPQRAGREVDRRVPYPARDVNRCRHQPLSLGLLRAE